MMPSHLIDLHEDLPYYIHIKKTWRDFGEEDPCRPADIPEYKKINARIIFASVFPLTNLYNPDVGRRMSELYQTEEFMEVVPLPSNPYLKAIELINTLNLIEERYNDEIKLIINRKDLKEVFEKKKLGFLISLEGTEALPNPSNLTIMEKLGVRSIGLTWNYDTKYGASCMSKKDYGLTGWGEELIKEMNSRGIIIDAAHTSKKTTIDILNTSKLPIVISHSNYRGLVNHPRNVDDEILEGLCRNRGVIGFTLIKSTLGEGDIIEALANHIVAVNETYGQDILAIGTDYFGIKTPPEAKRISALSKLWEVLKTKGFDEDTIEKIAWKNAYRVIKENSSRWKN